ncbi:unnamed protein product [Ilex paraguariensis]|uniref:Uncharacterized protein n=1 Tax=Ilex paraguariensis TaxID=185542 RepID=A0ABC8UEY4_9AQUA
MERSEPSLVPEWLKSGGSVTGGGTTAHQFPLSSLHPVDDHHTVSKPARNKSLVTTRDHDLGRLDRATSSYFRRSSSSNGSAHSRTYNNFGRSHRDRDWDKDIYGSRDKEKLILGDHKQRDYSDPLGSILPSRLEKEVLRRSQSMISGKSVEPKVATDSSSANKNHHSNSNSNSLLGGGSPISGVNKSAFERDFPSLGAEERQAAPEIGRVPSPGLITVIQSLPIGTSAVIGVDKWTSALAEVPAVVGSSGTSASSVQLAGPANSSCGASGTTALNMAETLAQGAPHAETTLQVSIGTQRLEERAIKQSRQLIPMTPSVPKALVLNSLEKPKPKVGQQQHQTSSSHLVSLSPRGGPVKSDVLKTYNVGKLHILRPARERNGVCPAKDSLSPTSGSKIANSPLAIAPSVVGSAPLRSPGNNPTLAIADCKPALGTLEKRPTSHVQSRNDFFNLVRQKSMTSSSSAVADPSRAVSPSALDKPGETEAPSASAIPQNGDAPLPDRSTSSQSIKRMSELASNGYACNGPQKSLNNGKSHSTSDAIICSEEEEAAFLRSLGWEENAGEDEGLTEEEIKAFYRDVSKVTAF